jgi:hypothetical protein
MTANKIRRVDFSPDEFLAGVNGMRADEIGVYWVVCSLIYSRGGPVDNDPQWIGRICSFHRATDCRRCLDRLIALGKLTVNADGQLENGRAMTELGRAHRRVNQAHDAADRAAIVHRKRGELVSNSYRTRVEVEGISAENNDLAEPGGSEPSTINHQPPKKESTTRPNGRVSPRSRKAAKGDQMEFPTEKNGVDHGNERHRLARNWRPSEIEREFAQTLGLDSDTIAEGFVLWWVEGKGRNEQRTDHGWNLTWRGWCRRDAERGGRSATPGNRPSHRPADGGGLAGAAARLRARYREQ